MPAQTITSMLHDRDSRPQRPACYTPRMNASARARPR